MRGYTDAQLCGKAIPAETAVEVVALREWGVSNLCLEWFSQVCVP